MQAVVRESGGGEAGPDIYARRGCGGDVARGWEAAAAVARIQNDLFDVGADLCVPIVENPEYKPLRITQAQVDWLEATIDALNAELPALTSFVLPGGTPAAAYLHQARTVVRRAERTLVTLIANVDEAINRLVLVYLNRLSDLLFVMSRYVNEKGAGDVLWVPGGSR